MSMRRNPKGRLTVDIDPWRNVVTGERRWGRLRDGLRVAVPFTVRFEPVDPSEGPTIEVQVDEHSGTLVTTSVSIIGSPEDPIDSHAVRVYSLPRLIAIGAKRVAMPAKGWEGYEEGEAWPPSNRRVMESIEAATRSRVSLDRDRLSEVAALHERGGVHFVQDGLNISRSQAYRLIKQAKADGFITEEDQ